MSLFVSLDISYLTDYLKLVNKRITFFSYFVLCSLKEVLALMNIRLVLDWIGGILAESILFLDLLFRLVLRFSYFYRRSFTKLNLKSFQNVEDLSMIYPILWFWSRNTIADSICLNTIFVKLYCHILFS